MHARKVACEECGTTRAAVVYSYQRGKHLCWACDPDLDAQDGIALEPTPEEGVIGPTEDQVAEARRLARSNGFAPRAWPEPMRDDAFHGLAGEIVRAIEPQTEADPAAVLVQFLAAVGNAVGRIPGWEVEATRHRCNLFVAIVGDTASGRKGTAWCQARRLVEMADPDWKARISSGLSSGEGLIWEVRDPIEERKKAKSKEDKQSADEYGFITELTDPGAEDKRLLVVETELASVLERMGREGNTLSTILRQAWDGDERLDTLVEHNRATATGAHISVIGHITAEELRRKLSATEQHSGFGNRWLWICARSSKLLPLGGEIGKVDWQPMLVRLCDALHYGMNAGVVDFDAESREMWIEAYPSSDRRPEFQAVRCGQ